jgi:hypothetical protein
MIWIYDLDDCANQLHWWRYNRHYLRIVKGHGENVGNGINKFVIPAKAEIY